MEEEKLSSEDQQVSQIPDVTAAKACEICLESFAPSKYRPAQRVCSKPECQKERQRRNIHAWNGRNPAYFRHIHANPYWREKRSERSRQWRLAHPERIREYRVLHREHYRLYMREYMRQYRKRRQEVA